MKETKQIQIGKIIFIEPQEPEPPVLPPVPVAVAVARVIGRPVQCAEVVPVPCPERLGWAQFEPVRHPDPFLPVPLVAFSEPLWAELRRWGRHFMLWSPRANQREWGEIGSGIIEDLCRFLGGFGEMHSHESGWLQSALWQSYAQPLGTDELRAADTAVNRARRQAERKRILAAVQVARLRARVGPSSSNGSWDGV